MKYLKTSIAIASVLALLLILNNQSFGQTKPNVPDQRIISVYGEAYTSNLKSKTPERIAYLNYFLDHSYEIREIPYNKEEKMTKVSEVDLNTKYIGNISRPTFNVNNFNVLLYNFKRNRKIKTLYRVDNTSKVIVFFSEEEITNAFNQTK